MAGWAWSINFSSRFCSRSFSLEIIDVDREAVFISSSGFFESLVIELLAAEASDSHITRLVGQVLVAELARALLENSVVERLRLIELFSVLRSILISVRVSLGCPARAIPQSWVHDVARAIIDQRLARSIQIGLVLHVLVDLKISFLRELTRRIPSSKDRFWLLLRIDIACAESCFVWSVLSVIIGVGLWHCLSTISSGSSVESIINLWDPFGVESEEVLININKNIDILLTQWTT